MYQKTVKDFDWVTMFLSRQETEESEDIKEVQETEESENTVSCQK